MPSPDLRDLLHVATDAAYLAGRRTLAYFNTGVAVQNKADASPVTIADKEAERILRERIAHSFPDHTILGEEEGETIGKNPDYRWIVDPIDGTKSFIAGVPLYGTLIGVEVRGEPAVGVLYLPALGEMICAANGLGCFWNNRPVRVSETKDLSKAVIVTSSILRCQARSDAFDTLSERTYLQRTWGDAFGYALVATGRADLMLDPAANPWDVAPMLPILREAGGNFAAWSGEVTIHGGDGFATNAALFGPICEILQSETRR